MKNLNIKLILLLGMMFIILYAQTKTYTEIKNIKSLLIFEPEFFNNQDEYEIQ